MREEDITVEKMFVRAFVSFAVAIAMALLCGGCLMPQGGWGGQQWGGGMMPQGGWGGQQWGGGQIMVRPPNSFVGGQPLGSPPTMANSGAQRLGSNYQAAALAGGQQGGAYVVAANPADPYGIGNQRVPQPGMFRVQTGCTEGHFFVPSTGTCSSTAWIPGVQTIPVTGGSGGVVETPANQMGAGGGIQGVPGQTMPYQQQWGGQQGFQQPGFGGGW